MKKSKKSVFKLILGFLTGVLNGLFGAGGGVVAVEALKHLGLNQKSAQATSIAVVLPLCILSAMGYYFKGKIAFEGNMWVLFPSGVSGAFFGTFLMKKISCNLLKKIFCVFLIYSGIRMLF